MNYSENYSGDRSGPVVAPIVAMDEDRVIGNNGTLPWHVPEDMAHFKALTTGHIVIMGRKTWDSLPPKFRPLANRLNIVVTRNPSALEVPAGVHVAQSPGEAIAWAKKHAASGQMIWILGGGTIYRETQPEWDAVYLTVIPGRHEGDTRFDPFEHDFVQIAEEQGATCRFFRYERRK